MERLPEAISGAALYRSVLPVSYRKSAVLLLEQIERVRPDAVVMLGQAGGRAKITPERIAVNLDHCEARDNDGEPVSYTHLDVYKRQLMQPQREE